MFTFFNYYAIVGMFKTHKDNKYYLNKIMFLN